jgi:4-oxalocrotonate tautomerase
MPHVVVTLWPGKSEQQKIRLAEEIVKDVMDVLQHGEESVSLAIEEVGPQDWAEKVYKPERPRIQRRANRWGAPEMLWLTRASPDTRREINHSRSIS